MTISGYREKTPPLVYLLIIILPFLLFYWMAPFIADKSIGLDYQTTSIENQMELLFSIKTGSFPLYVPGFALGHSSSALTLGGIYHPLSHIASTLPGYWDGKALQYNTFLRLLSLGLAHLALFGFLRKLKIITLFSFLLSCITVYNLRMLDLFRYGASLENYTAFILLCSAIGWYFVDKAKYRGPLCIIAATYLLINGGHPQMMYYGLLGAGLFLLITPFYVSTMLPEIHVDFRVASRFWIQVVICIILGILLSLAYILPFYFEFIATNVARIKQGYGWADSVRDTFSGTLNSFFLPLRSDVHGAFGGSSIIIMAALLPVMRFFRKIPLAIWAAWGVALFVFLYMQGARTPVHQLVWEYVPLASSFRYSGRIALMMPMFLMMVLAWVIKAEPLPVPKKIRSVISTPASFLSVIALVCSTAYLLFFIISYSSVSLISMESSPFAPVAIRHVPRSSEALLIVFGLSSLLLIAFLNKRPKAASTLGIILCLTTLLQVGTTLKYGTWITERNDKPTFEQMQVEKRDKLLYRFYPGTGMYSSIVTAQLENSFMEPFLGKIYHYAETVSSLDDAYAKMLKRRTPQEVFLEGYKPKDDLLVASKNAAYENSKVELVYSSFNRLQFRAISPVPAFLGLSYPYTGHWNASVNGKKNRVYRANGSAHAVEIPNGESLIEFRYSSPYYVWGMLISFSTFILIWLFLCIRAFDGMKRVTFAICVLVLGAGLFLMWHHSLYTGSNLNTEYTWTYKPTSQTPNLAYGKKTSMSSHLRGSPGYIHSSRATDGNTAPSSGFSTPKQDNPSWTVDLNRLEKIKTIILYESTPDPSTNKRPLNIDFSEDGKQWRTVYSVTFAVNPAVPTKIFFKTPESARYIRIQAAGFGSLGFDEVEIYSVEVTRV